MIDLGEGAAAPQAQWVVQACNEGVAAGTCETPNPSKPQEVPRAVAVVTTQGQGARSIRIEVRRTGDASTALISRRLSFGALDPERERWRSVGFAIAILVGRVEREQLLPQSLLSSQQPNDTEPPSDTESPDTGPPDTESPPNIELPLALEPSPAVEASTASVESVPAFQAVRETADSESSQELFEAAGLFAGVFAMAGLGTSGVRSGTSTGAGLGVGWQSEVGWLLNGQADFSRAESANLLIRRTQLLIGGGARIRISNAWSVAGNLSLGARWLSVDLSVADGGASLQEQGAVWSPVAGISANLQWQAASSWGLWARANTTTPFAKTRVVDARDGSEPVSVPFAEPTLGLGLWLWL